MAKISQDWNSTVGANLPGAAHSIADLHRGDGRCRHRGTLNLDLPEWQRITVAADVHQLVLGDLDMMRKGSFHVAKSIGASRHQPK